MSGNALFTRTSDAAGRYWDNGVMVGVTRALTSTVSVFAKMSGVLPAERPDAWTLDAGVAWVARPSLQWDVSAGHTFHDRGDDWFLSAGITVRRRWHRSLPSSCASESASMNAMGSLVVISSHLVLGSSARGILNAIPRDVWWGRL